MFLKFFQEVPVQVGYILVFTFIHFKYKLMAVLNIFYQYLGVFNNFHIFIMMLNV